jgi:hypothetical protein
VCSPISAPGTSAVILQCGTGKKIAEFEMHTAPHVGIVQTTLPKNRMVFQSPHGHSPSLSESKLLQATINGNIFGKYFIFSDHTICNCIFILAFLILY